MAKDEDGSSNLNVDYEIDNIPPYNPRHRDSIAFKKAVYQPPDDIWNLFSEAENCCDIIDYFNALVKVLNINPDTHGLEFYDILKSKLTSWKCQSLWDLLNARQKHSEYQYGNAAKGKNCMIIGGGPIGLRTAIESLLLGCKTVVVEKREEFSRNNVLHLWPFLMTDFRNLGAKKFYGKFGAGCIEHINIRTLQCILLKVALILGAEIYVGVCFEELVEPTNEETGWTAKYNPENHILSKYEFDIIIGADGKKNVLPGFRQIELRGALAIGITCNFVNNNTIEEARVNEISGISFQYNQEFFHKMEAQYGVRLENIVYYKDETHYFVMTALKASLLKLGVIKQDLSDPVELLSSSNTDNDKLLEFTRSAVNYATDHQLPEDLEFKTLSNGKPDIALFDFTSIKKASNASRIIERKKHKLLMALVGDSLIEPFWPTGSGAGRGVLSALDTAWLIKQFSGSNPPLATMRERENIYKLLSGTTNDSLQKNYKTFTIDPKTRYTAFDSKKVSNMVSLKSLYDTDDVENADFSVMSPIQLKEAHQRRAQGRRRLSSGGSSSKKKSVTSSHVHLHGQKHVKKRHDRSPSKESKPINVVNTKEFWEEHNKKNMSERAKQHVPKQIKLTNVDDDESAGEWSEIDDAAVKEVPVFVTPIEKSSRVGRSLKRQQTDQTKKQTNENKEKSLKRKKSRDHLKRQKPRDDLSPTKGRSGKAKTPDKERSRKRIDSKGSTGKKENTKAKVSAKQEPPRPVDPKGFFRSWYEKIRKKYEESFAGSDEDEERSVIGLATQSAAFSVMMIPLMLDCNRPPKRRTTDIKLKDLQLAKNNFLQASDDRKESQEISMKRAGSVKNTIAKLKMKVEEDKSEDYYEFLKKNRTNGGSDGTDGRRSTTFVEKSDFTPKDVVDVEKSLLMDEEKQKTGRISKSASQNGGVSRNELELRLSLEEFCDLQTSNEALVMLQILFNMHKRIHDEPDVEKYYRVYVKGTIFGKNVWQLEGSEKFLLFSGWVKCGNYIVLSKGHPVKTNLKVIEETLRKKKKAEALNGTPLSMRKGAGAHRKRSNLGESTINEDELVASFTNIETDSICDGQIDDENEIMRNKLRRVESREHLVGDEEYVVVDFVGNVELSSRKSSRIENEPNEIFGESAIGSSLSPSPTASPCNENRITPHSSIEHHEAERHTTDEGYVDSSAGDDNKLQSTTSVSEEEQPEIDINKQHEKREEEKIEFSKEKFDNDENIAYQVGGVKETEKVKDASVDHKDRNSPTTTLYEDEKPVMRRSSSERSSRPNSIVMQNKRLFDQQISGQMKRRPSVESQDSQRSSRENSFKGKRSGSKKSLNERPVSGTVAGARTMFESGNTTPVKSISSRKSSLQTVDDAENVKKEEETTPSVDNPLLQNFKSSEVVKSPKKKRFPFKKKKSDRLDDSPKKLTVGVDKKESTSDVELLKIQALDEEVQERAIDVPVEMTTDGDKTEQEKKKKGIFSRMRRTSRKGSDSSDNEPKSSPEKHYSPIKHSPSVPLNVEETSHTQLEDDVLHKIPTENENPNQHPVEQDLTLNLSVHEPKTDTKLPTPDDPPPSPGYASLEIKSVLENIIERKPSYNSTQEESVKQSTPKKKRLGLKLKKKSSSKKEKESKSEDISNEEIDANVKLDANEKVDENGKVDENEKVDANEKVDEKVVANEKFDEKVDANEEVDEKVDANEKVDENEESKVTANEEESTRLIQTGAVISDWPVADESEEQVAGVEDIGVDIMESVQESTEVVLDPTTEQNVENPNKREEQLEATQDKTEDVPIEKPPPIAITLTGASDENLDKNDENLNDTSTLDQTQDSRDDTLEESIEGASPTLSDSLSMNDDTVSINTNASSPEKKKKKLHFHFPKRKSKKKEKEKQESIWEETTEKDSKKLKRPKSLDFLAGKIHTKSKNEKNRPVSMLPGDLNAVNLEHENEPIQKSPKIHKKKSFNLFKKKKKQTTEPVDITKNDSNMKDTANAPPSPIAPSPDAYTIPELDTSVNIEHEHNNHHYEQVNASTNGTNLSSKVSL